MDAVLDQDDRRREARRQRRERQRDDRLARRIQLVDAGAHVRGRALELVGSDLEIGRRMRRADARAMEALTLLPDDRRDVPREGVDVPAFEARCRFRVGVGESPAERLERVERGVHRLGEREHPGTLLQIQVAVNLNL